MSEAYPLHWPQGFPRTKTTVKSQFRTTLAGALNNVDTELQRFANNTGKRIEGLVISSNFSLSSRNPTDGGVAVYFRWDGIDVCIPADRYKKVEENVQAIAKVIEAHRAILRHGGLNIVRAGFRGFAALPPPKGPGGQLVPPWRVVLFGEHADGTLADAENAYRHAVKKHHPDRGGDAATFNKFTDAIRQAREELKA